LGIKFFEIFNFGHSALDFVVFFLFFEVFCGCTAFDFLMGDYTWFWVVLGIKLGFQKFSDFRKIEFFCKQEKKIFIELISL